jgi:hypothetical protein
MTMPPAVMPDPVDVANTLLAPGPATLTTGINGQMGLITIRTPTTTLTVQLPKADMLSWGKMITELGEQMTGGSPLLVAAPGTVLMRS